jgi:hypothetical protein
MGEDQSDDEMRRLMIQASAKLANMLRMKQEDPAKYEIFIREVSNTPFIHRSNILLFRPVNPRSVID